MAEDKGWFTRQASRTAEDIKQIPEWLRSQRGPTSATNSQSTAIQEPKKTEGPQNS